MTLQSALFRGDAQLEAAAVANPAHIVPGATGDHVGKLQHALKRLDRAAIDAQEVAGQRYGPSTARAVLAYKEQRRIINPAYQRQADDVVGIMTMAALDKEMLQLERDQPLTKAAISCETVRPRRPVAPA